MKLYQWGGICFLSVAAIASGALAQSDTQGSRAQASRAAPPKFSGQSPTSSEVWTTADIHAMCRSRWENQQRNEQNCEDRNQRRIGHDKSPGEIQELAIIARKDPANAAAGVPVQQGAAPNRRDPR